MAAVDGPWVPRGVAPRNTSVLAPSGVCPHGKLWVPDLPLLQPLPVDPCAALRTAQSTLHAEGPYAQYSASGGAFSKTRKTAHLASPCESMEVPGCVGVRKACGSDYSLWDFSAPPHRAYQRGEAEIFLTARLAAAGAVFAPDECITPDPQHASAAFLIPHMPKPDAAGDLEWIRHSQRGESCYGQWRSHLKRMWRDLATRAPHLTSRRRVFVFVPHAEASQLWSAEMSGHAFIPVGEWLPKAGWSVGYTGHFHPPDQDCLRAWQHVLTERRPRSLIAYRGSGGGKQNGMRALMTVVCTMLAHQLCRATNASVLSDYFDATFCVMLAGDPIADALQMGCIPVFMGKHGALVREQFGGHLVGRASADDWSVHIHERRLLLAAKTPKNASTPAAAAAVSGPGRALSSQTAWAGPEPERKPPEQRGKQHQHGKLQKLAGLIAALKVDESNVQRILRVSKALVNALQEIPAEKVRSMQQTIVGALSHNVYARPSSTRAVGPDAVTSLVQTMLAVASGSRHHRGLVLKTMNSSST